MKAPNLLALAAASLITIGTLAAMTAPVRVAPVAYINGTKVVDLAPVLVHPSAAERREAAAAAGISGIAGALLAPTLGVRAETRAGLLGAQLTMPYYSFGARSTGVRKD